MREWNFLTAHAQALLLVAKQPSVTTSEIASAIGVTRSRVHTVMVNLVADGYISKSRDGREFRYQINPNMWLSDEKHRELEICDYLGSLLKGETRS